MESFNLSHFWAQGDGFGHFISIVLLIMSVLSWGVIFLRLALYKNLRQLPKALNSYWNNPDPAVQLESIKRLDREQLLTPIAQLAQHTGNTAALERKLSQAVRTSQHKLEQGLTLLATIASSAPFVGLLGTVWGIYRTLSTVAAQGQMDVAKIIGPVGEALIMTAVGLSVALPALFAYNFFNRNNQTHQTEIDAFAHDILNQHLGQ